MLGAKSAWRTGVLLLLFSGSTAACGVEGDWFEGNLFAGAGSDEVARFFHRASLLSDGRVLVSGGMMVQALPPSLVSLDRLSVFDPATGEFHPVFTQTSSAVMQRLQLNAARSSHTQTTLPDGRVFITGGYAGATGMRQGNAIDSVEFVDLESGTVEIGPPMGQARADHSATLLSDGRVLVAGGGSWQVFDPSTDSWSQEHPLQRTRIAHAALAVPAFAGNDERVLIVGGSGSGSDTLELLCASGGISELSAARLSVGVDDLAAAMLESGRVLIVGGQNPATGETTDLAYLYDLATEELSSLPAPPNASAGISDHQIAAIGSRAYLFGGEAEAQGQDTELDYAAFYDEQTGEWELLPRMTQPRDDFAAVVLPDGRVALIAGGTSFFGLEIPTNTAEVFSPP